MSAAEQHIVLCSGVKLKAAEKRKVNPARLLELQLDGNSAGQNIKIGLPYFVQQVNCKFPERIKDLLEIAGYIYAADRLIKRGLPGQLEYHNWSRDLHFHIRVRDFKFWNSQKVKIKLGEMLTFMSGDKAYNFTFHPDAKDVGQMNMFDTDGIEFDSKENSSVAMFSGGLDSLAGALEKLETTDEKLFIISHRSNNPAVSSIQKSVYNMIKRDYEGRVKLYPFECNLTGDRAAEETQRTRVFLYTSIALSLAIHTNKGEINVFENGVTSLNLSKRQDLINARASRTTHPKTLRLIQDFFKLVADKDILINHPFIYKTKKDIFDIIAKYKKEGYINSTLSCTKTFNKFKNNSQATHCGVCSQCIDRRMSAFASGLENYDAMYDCDISKDDIPDEEGRSHLNSYLRFNMELSKTSPLNFYSESLDAMADFIPYLPGNSDGEKAQAIYDLLKANADNALTALRKIRAQENLHKPKTNNSLFSIIDNRNFLMTDPERMAHKIAVRLNEVIPISFRSTKPSHENSLNDAIQAHLKGEGESYEREFPTVRFSFGTTIPDHSFDEYSLFIEAKYIKRATQKSKITDEIAADITKYPKEKMKLFIVYDPEGKIADKPAFVKSFHRHSNVKVQVIK